VSALDALVEELAEEITARVVEALRAKPVTQVEPEGWCLLTTEEAADRLGRSERWVRARVKDGTLPWIRLDEGPLRFRLEDLRAFAAERRVPAEAISTRLPPYRNPSNGNGSGAERRSTEPGVRQP
jgi:excisionase family DNA binding protein